MPEPRWVEPWVYHDVREWLDVALICERLHVLPNEGGVFQQDPNLLRRLMIVFGQLDQYRSEELDNVSNT